MPELPEVETVVATLRSLIKDDRILEVDQPYTGIVQSRFFDVIGEKIKDINRIGKYILMELDSAVLIVHLRMEGKFYIKIDEPYEKHEHVIFYLESGRTLRYHDTRKFGTMELVDYDQLETYFSTKLGIDPTKEKLTTSYLRAKAHKQTLKGYLLDQHIVAGLGNIYVNEVCFLLGRHPAVRVNRLRVKDFDALVEIIPQVLNKAISLGGTTIRTYTDSLGVTGRFQNELYVHEREGEECKVCSDTIRKVFVNGRGTYYCPTCQPRR